MEDKKSMALIGGNGPVGEAIVKYGIKKFFVHMLLKEAPTFGINSIFLKMIDGDPMKPEDL